MGKRLGVTFSFHEKLRGPVARTRLASTDELTLSGKGWSVVWTLRRLLSADVWPRADGVLFVPRGTAGGPACTAIFLERGMLASLAGTAAVRVRARANRAENRRRITRKLLRTHPLAAGRRSGPISNGCFPNARDSWSSGASNTLRSSSRRNSIEQEGMGLHDGGGGGPSRARRLAGERSLRPAVFPRGCSRCDGSGPATRFDAGAPCRERGVGAAPRSHPPGGTPDGGSGRRRSHREDGDRRDLEPPTARGVEFRRADAATEPLDPEATRLVRLLTHCRRQAVREAAARSRRGSPEAVAAGEAELPPALAERRRDALWKIAQTRELMAATDARLRGGRITVSALVDAVRGASGHGVVIDPRVLGRRVTVAGGESVLQALGLLKSVGAGWTLRGGKIVIFRVE